MPGMSPEFNAAMHLCDDDGIVRSGALHHGTDFVCTGSAHAFGAHVLCSQPHHTAEPAAAPVNWKAIALQRERELRDVGEARHRAESALAEMTRLRDNALRASEHADQSIDVDLEGDLRDGLHGLYDWDENQFNRVVNRAVVIVRPIVAHAVKRAETAEATITRESLIDAISLCKVEGVQPIEGRVTISAESLAVAILAALAQPKDGGESRE